MSFLKKLFGSVPEAETPAQSTAAATAEPPVTRAKRLLVYPESDADVEAIRAADPLMGEFNFGLRAALMPRSERSLADARARRKPPAGDIHMEDMGDGNFSVTLGRSDAVAQSTIDAIAAEYVEPFPVLLWPRYNGDPEAEEGLLVFHVTHGGIGYLPPGEDSPDFNALFLNLELRTGTYAACKARLVRDGDAITFRLDLARYGVCYNRCQRILHERNAGAIYEP